MTDDQLRDLFGRVRVIALIGASANPGRPSHGVMRFLQGRGFRVIPVNPGLAGQELLGAVVYPDLAAGPGDVDMVDGFRQSAALPGIVDDALARWPGLPVLWTQLGVVHDAAAAVARAAGVTVVQNRCPAIEIPRLFPGSFSVV